jgi:PPOX class probable F420-dependent enzyme
MSTPASIPESHHDLAAAPGVNVFTTVGADGLPQSTAIWAMVDGDVIRTSLQTDRQKYRNISRNPVATLFYLDPANPMRTLEIRGDVTTEPDPDAVFLDELLAHYGADPATFPAPREGRVVVTLTPRRVVAIG